MRSPAFLEHEPPMLLGLSWSELSTLFFPSILVWFVVAAIFSVFLGSINGFLLGLLVFVLGTSCSLSALAIWFRHIRRCKSVEGWHWHRIATGLYSTGWFHIVHRNGKWRV